MFSTLHLHKYFVSHGLIMLRCTSLSPSSNQNPSSLAPVAILGGPTRVSTTTLSKHQTFSSFFPPDLDPVRLEDRKWTTFNFIVRDGAPTLLQSISNSVIQTYWISDAWNAATFQFAASIIAIGLSWREAVPCVALAFIIISVPIALNGIAGSM